MPFIVIVTMEDGKYDSVFIQPHGTKQQAYDAITEAIIEDKASALGSYKYRVSYIKETKRT